MNEYHEATTKGKVYFYSLILFGLFGTLIGQNFNTLFPVTGSQVEQLLATGNRYFYVALINAVLLSLLTVLVIYIAVQTHKHKQYPPPNIHVPFRHKVKLIIHPYKIWLCASFYVAFFLVQIFMGLQSSYQFNQLSDEIIQAIEN